MKPKLLFSVIIAIAFLSSCQKPFTDEFATTTTSTSGSSATRPKTYTENIFYAGGGHDSVTFNLSYDASNRLTSMVSAASSGDRFVYQYSGSTIIMDLYNSNVLNIHEIFFLNSFTYVDSTFQYNSTKDTITEKYFFNSSNQLIKINRYDYSVLTGAVLNDFITITYDANGNEIKETENTPSSSTSYTYTSIPYALSLGFDLGPVPKYFVNTETNISGGVTTILTHSYTFDSSKRLTVDKITSSAGDIVIKSYTY